MPRLFSGRSWSDSLSCFQLDLAWRINSNVRMGDSGHGSVTSQRQPLYQGFDQDQKVKAELEWNCDSCPTPGSLFLRGLRIGDGLVD